MKDEQRQCCDSDCDQGRSCTAPNTSSFAAYVVVVVCAMLSAVCFIYWANS